LFLLPCPEFDLWGSGVKPAQKKTSLGKSGILRKCWGRIIAKDLDGLTEAKQSAKKTAQTMLTQGILEFPN
jgi:hypothetical protein